MKYPTLAEMNTSREWLDVFKGYNHNLRIGDGEFYEMTNLSSDNYPILSPRPKRGEYAIATKPQGMVAKDSLCYIDNGDFFLNGKRLDLPEWMRFTEEKDEEGKIIPKTLISMGAYVIVMPDKKYINTENKLDYGKIEATVETEGNITFSLCTVEGAEYQVPEENARPTPPEITEKVLKGEEEAPYWIDTSNTPHALKQYSISNATWSTIATTYIKISSDGIGLSFEVNDGITIRGVEGIDDLSSPTSAVIVAKDDRIGDNEEKISNWIVVKGMLSETKTQPASKPITIERLMPTMDFIIESENRLWGCRYGPALNGAVVNEIYASALGDFKNWNCFQQISTDSYVVSVGSDGPFTGAITHLGYPLFFKENCVHKIYGNYPANFQIQTTPCRGVQNGCSKSLAIVNEVLYYKARSGICAYDGSLPVEISSALGDVGYSKAIAGALGNKYYVSMMDSNDKYHLFVYDTLKGMWHREDDAEIIDFCNCRGDLYFIAWGSDSINTIRGTGNARESKIKWEAVTGVMGTDSPDKKYISRMDVRMKLEVGARVTFMAEYDSSGEWKYLYSMTGKNIQSFAVPIRPQRCDHLRLRIIGEGDAKIYSIAKTVEWGSDV